MSEDKSQPKQGISRRQALKAIAATSGVLVASSLLPERWSRPVLNTGVLPAHAQISGTETSTSTPTSTPTPTATPIPPVTIVECRMSNNDELITPIYPSSTILLQVDIRTERSDIESIPLVLVLSTAVTQLGEKTPFATITGTATVLPTSQPNEATFEEIVDLTAYDLAAGLYLWADWAFQNPQDSNDTCGRSSLLEEEPN